MTLGQCPDAWFGLVTPSAAGEFGAVRHLNGDFVVLWMAFGFHRFVSRHLWHWSRGCIHGARDYRTVCQYRLPCLPVAWNATIQVLLRENQRIAAQRWHLPVAEAQFNTTVER